MDVIRMKRDFSNRGAGEVGRSGAVVLWWTSGENVEDDARGKTDRVTHARSVRRVHGVLYVVRRHV